ncbi:MAG: GHKL domain-containing protein, partial [Elusimicrobia bacterium]|nr:GHKL domain-containing protein [Elusimicrobiota bacterium]
RVLNDSINVYVFEDITEKKEITLERDRLSEIISKIGAGLVVFRKTGEILFTNRFIEKVFGSIGENCKILLEEMNCPIDDIQQKIEEKKVAVKEIKFGEMYFMASFSEILWDGEINYLCILKDITPLVVAREELKERVAELRKEKLHTLSILEDLKQANDRIRAMQNALIHRERLATIGEIAAGVAHELNNPLTAIMTYTDLLDDKKLTDEEKEYISKIRLSAKRMQRTVQNLLTYSRAKSKGKSTSNINDVIKDSLDFMEPSLKREDVAVELFLSDVPETPLDRDELSGVFVNLFTNAINALKEKQEKKIEIKSFFDEKQKKIFVLFKDNGCGIDEKNLGKIFEIFFTTREDGNGIGLAVARNIVRDHGGEISVKSKKGEWTEFSLEFPIGGG